MFQASLDKVYKKENELRNANSNHKYCINDLRASIPALKETLNSLKVRCLKSRLSTPSYECLKCNTN